MQGTISCGMFYHVKKKNRFFIMEPFFKIHDHCLKGKTSNWLQFSFFFIFNANVTLFIEIFFMRF